MLFKAIFAALLAGVSWAQDTWEPRSLRAFGGQNSFNESSKIDAGDAQETQNVRTDRGYLEKRRGSTRLTTFLSGFSVDGVYSFTSPSNTKFLVAHSSKSIYQTDLGASPTAIATMTVSQTVDHTVGFGNIYFADSVQVPISWNGTSTAGVTNMPICKYLEFANDRLYCANIASESTSRVRVSSFGGSGWWTIPSNVSQVDDAPTRFDFQKDDGEPITCLKNTRCGLFFGKRSSTHILKGYGNLTYYKKVIDPKIGCVDDRSVQVVDGLLVWAGQDGVYAWDCEGAPEIISKDIEDKYRQIRQLDAVSDSWTVDAQSEWQRGSVISNGPTGSWDLSTDPGTIFPSSMTMVYTSSADFALGTFVNVSSEVAGSVRLSSVSFRDNFEDGSFTTDPAWVVTGDAAFELEALGGSTRLTHTGVGASLSTITITAAEISTGSWAFTYRLKTTGVGGNARCSGGTTGICLDFRIAVNAGLSYYALRLRSVDAANFRWHFIEQASDGSAATTIADEGTQGLAEATNYAFEIQRSTDGRFYIYRDEVFRSSGTDTTISSSTKVEVMLFSDGNYDNFLDSVTVYQYRSPASYTSGIFDTRFSTPLGGPLSSTCTVPADTYAFYDVRSSTSPNDDLWSSFAAASDTVRISEQNRYQQLRIRMTTHLSTRTPVCDGFQTTYASTGNYRSEVKFIGTDITSWRTVDFSDSVSPSAVAKYYVRSATYSFAANAEGNGLGWFDQSNHQEVGVSTAAYYQFRVDSSSMSSSSQTFAVYRQAVYWQEGTEKPMASAVFDRNYFLCVTVSSESTKNDTCFVWQKNRRWVTDTGPSIGGLAIYDNEMIGVDGSTNSYAWKMEQDNVYRDDTSAIAAHWITKDFTAENTHLDQELQEMWFEAAFSSSASVDIGYAVNKSTAFLEKTAAINDNAAYINKRVSLDNGYDLGKYFKFRIKNSDVDEYFRVNEFMFYTKTKSRSLE